VVVEVAVSKAAGEAVAEVVAQVVVATAGKVAVAPMPAKAADVALAT